MITVSQLAKVRLSPVLTALLWLVVLFCAFGLGQFIQLTSGVYVLEVPRDVVGQMGQAGDEGASIGPGHDIYHEACADIPNELEWEACNLLQECAALQERATNAGMEVVCVGGAL